MNTPLVLLEGDQLEIDFDIDKPQFSICPQCSGDIIKLADGCGICGWREVKAHSIWPYSIPCIVKQPNHPELSGIIRQDLGAPRSGSLRDRFIVEIPSQNSTLTIPKLYVFPDFSQFDNSPRKKPPRSKNISDSNKSPRKLRRKKGEGNGSIYFRTVTKNGKQYQEAYYHWRENGKKRTKYIPKSY